MLERQSVVLPSMPGDLLLFLTTKIKKMAVWKTTFVSKHLNTEQSQLIKCFAFVAALAILAKSTPQANHAKSAKLIVDYFSHVFFLTCTHRIDTNAKMCFKPLCLKK